MTPTNTLSPIRVYLDSQDFIALSKQPLPQELEIVFEKLVALREGGSAEFGISLFHIAEVLNPDSVGYEDYQKHCGEVIYRLTDGNAFPFISDFLKGASYPNDGMWLPKFEAREMMGLLEPGSVRRMLQEYLRDHTSLSRAQRRALAKPEQLATFVKQYGYNPPPIFDVMGVEEEEVQAILLESFTARKSLATKLIKFLTDPRYYCKAIGSVRPGENPLRQLLDTHMSKARNSLFMLFRELQELKRSSEKLQEELLTLREISVSLFGLDSDNVREIDGKIKHNRRQVMKVMNSAPLPNGAAQLAFLKTYYKGMYRIGREPSSSEVIDLLHLVYHSDVDLIRTDRRMAELMKDDPDLKGKIVSRLVKLPDAIQIALKQRPFSSISPSF